MSKVRTRSQKRGTWWSGTLLAAGLFACAIPGAITAQAPGWTATLLVQPFPSPFIADWERNPQMAVLNLFYSGTGPQDFRVEGFIRSAERGELARVISPPIYFGFGPVTQIVTSADILDWETVNEDRVYVDQVVRTGMIPEGRHQMCARVLDTQNVELVSTCADFTIALPEPPQLIFPADRNVVAGLLPVFQWTPIFLPPEIGASYRLQLFELFEGQTPETAVLANRVWFEAETTAPVAVYPLDALPLDPMKAYVWAVEALDGDGRPVTRGGRSSEIWTFTIGGPGRELGESGELPDTLMLIPGTARLSGLRSAQISLTDFAYVVNGWLNLELEAPFPAVVRVEAHELEIDRTSVLALPIVRGGDLRGTIRADNGLQEAAGSFVRFRDVEYDVAAGLTLGAELALPGTPPLPLDGRIQVTAAGLYGSLEGDAASGATLAHLGRTPMEYAVTRARLQLPLGGLELAGHVRLLRTDLDCPAGGTVVDDVLVVSVLCMPDAGFAPGGADTRALVTFGAISGSLRADFLGDRLEGELRTQATLQPFGDVSAGCTVSFTLLVARDSLARADERGDCDAGRARAEFGWITMGLSSLRLDRFELLRDGGIAWRALVDLAPEARGAENLQLPYISGVVLDESGVSLPASSSDAPGTQSSGMIEIGGARLLPRTMGFVGGLVPYDRWLSGRDPGFEWGSGTSWITFPQVTFEQSSCLNGLPFEADTLVIRSGRIDVTLEDHAYENGCLLRLADRLHVKLTSVTGSVGFELGETPRLTELPFVAADLVHPDLDCGLPVIGCTDLLHRETLDGELRLTPEGRLRGTAQDFHAGWIEFDLRFAKLIPATSGGRLELAVSDSGKQTAIYDGPVNVTFDRVETEVRNDSTAADTTATADSSLVGRASGTATTAMTGVLSGVRDTATARARIDVIANRLLSGDISLEGPFKLELGFLKFIIDRATLSRRGLLVDGRQRMLVDTTSSRREQPNVIYDTVSTNWPIAYSHGTDSVGVTFAGVYLDPSSGDISSGVVGMDGGLALESSPTGLGLAVATGSSLTAFTLARADDPFDPKSEDWGGGNIKLSLPGVPAFGTRGFRVEGVAPAQVSVRGSRFDSASVSFEDGFTIQPVSGRVTAGRAQVRVRQYPIAHLDASGWHLSIAELLTSVIPDTLFLTDRATAFIPLRDADRNLLVLVDSTAEGMRFYTRAGETLRLVVPALKGTRPAAPTLDVMFDLVLERGSFRPIAGSLHAIVTTGTADGHPMADFPFVLDSIDLRVPQGRDPSFFAYGRLALLSGQQPLSIALGLQGGGVLDATVEQPFSDDLALVPGVSPLRFGIDTLRFQAQGRLDETFAWRLELPGHIVHAAASGQQTRLATATFRLSPVEAALVDFESPDSLFRLPLPGIDLLLGRFRAPLLRWDIAQSRFDFEFLFDAALEIPLLDSLRLPEIRDVRITTQGLVVPAFELANVSPVPDPNSPFESGTDTLHALRVGGFAVRALAYRVEEFRWDWSAQAAPPELGFGVDLELSVEDIPSGLEGQSARLTLRALDVGFSDGRFTGSIERVDFPRPLRTPVADIHAAFGTFSVSSSGAPDVRVGVVADLRLPEVLACPGAESGTVSLVSAADTLFLDGNGTIYGAVHDLLPACTTTFGPIDVVMGSNTVRFGFDAPSSAVTAELDASVTVRLPGDQAGNTISATGHLVLDLVHGVILDAQASIDEPFFWAPDPANPFLRLVVNQASLDQRWLRFGATGQLRTNEGAGVDVAFENVAFDLNTSTLASGRIRVTADAAVGIEIPSSGDLVFGVFPANEPRSDGVSARIVLPSGAVIDTAGLQLSGTATASLGYGGETYAALSATFDSGFTIGFAPRVAITGGRLDLRNAEGDLIAYVNRLGFWPGNLFALLPIPAQLGLTDVEVAYLQLRSPSDTALLLIETVFSGETVQLRTRPNEHVDLVLPSLAGEGAAPVLRTSLDLVLNARTLLPVSGEIVISSQSNTPLITLPGYPVDITELGFRSEAGGYRLRLGARAVLPGPLEDVDLVFRNLELSPSGLSGQVELGQYSETYVASAPTIAEAQLRGDTLSVRLTGARLTLAPENNVVEVSGVIRSTFLASANGAPRAIQLTGRVDAQGFIGTADVNDRETPIAIGAAALTLESALNQPAIVVEATAQEFSLRLGGTLRLPSLAPGFALSVRDLRVGSAGITLPEISIAASTNTAEFELFGARFALRDSVVGAIQVAPAVAVELDAGIVRLTMSGYVTFLQNTTRFIGLQIGTDGSFALQGADFISRPIDIIPDYARFTRARIANSIFELAGDVRLPAPFADQAPQELVLRLLPDGRVTGGGRIVLISEPQGLERARTTVSVGVAKFHLRHLDLEFDFENEANTAASMVADIYVQDDLDNPLRFGRVIGGTVTPGIRVAVNGSVTWGGLVMPHPITVTMAPVTLRFTQATVRTADEGFTVAIGGWLELAVAGGEGSLRFQNVGFTSGGEILLGEAEMLGGRFTIQDKVIVNVDRVAWNSQESSIYVPVAAAPTADGSVRPDSTLVTVNNYLDLGGRVDVAGVFSGGVERVLVYQLAADGSTHLLIRNLRTEIPDIIQFNASLSYDELPGGFDLSLATSGILLGRYEAAMVGVMRQRANQFSAGIFLRTSVEVPLVPGVVTLTGVGGGFFINPTAGDLQLVKNVAGLNGPSADRLGMPPASLFAVMLYASVDIVGAGGLSAASGRAMLTVTDKAAQLNAMATFFEMDRQISGDLALQVGWSPAAYVRGDISLVVAIDNTVEGGGGIQFFAGSNTFAVKGNVNLTVVKVLTVFAEVIIVPSGFTANMGFNVSKSTDVLAVSVGANLRLWYRPSTQDLGAYLRFIGQVTAFGVTGEISMIGALVLAPQLAIYAQGTARVVGVDFLTIEAWAQYTSSGLAVGLGRSEELAAALARAEQVAADLEAEADAILAGIDAAAQELARTPIPVSRESLAAAYANFQRWNWLQMLAEWEGFRAMEGTTRGGLLPTTAADPYVAFYERVLSNAEAAADTAEVVRLRAEAEQKLAVIAERRTGVEARIRALRLELLEIEATAAYVPPTDPVTTWSAGSPALVEGPPGTDGAPTMILTGAPVFELDDDLAAAAQGTMTAAQTVTVARQGRMRDQILAVEAGLGTVLAATSATDAQSFASYARLHSDVVETVERQHAVNVEFRMRRRSWAQTRLDTLGQERAGIEQRLDARFGDITAYQQSLTKPGWARRFSTAVELDTLASRRVRYLSAWAGEPALQNTYASDGAGRRADLLAAGRALQADSLNGAASAELDLAITWFRTQALNYGLRTWWEVADAGLTQARDGAQVVVQEAVDAAEAAIRPVRDQLGSLTTSLAELNDNQQQLYGVLYDLYDEYLRVYGASGTEGQQFAARRTTLAELLQAPRVTSPRVVVTDYGFVSSIATTWSGTHPRGVYEYLLQEGNDSLHSVGSVGEARRWAFSAQPAGGTFARSQHVYVRGGVGLTGQALSSYTLTFASTPLATPRSTVAVPPIDLTPPTRPVVQFVGLPTLMNSDGVAESWTADSTRVTAQWSASDVESGIAEFEYRVATYPPTQTTTLTSTEFGPITRGRPVAPVVLVDWTSVGGRTSAAIQGMRLQAGQAVWVEVRARNGAGLLGDAGTSQPLRFDPTPPAFPVGSQVTPSGGTFSVVRSLDLGTTTPPVVPACGAASSTIIGATSTRPVWDGRLVTVTPNAAVVGGGAQVRLTLSRPDATDSETGIYGYNYRVDSVAPGPVLPNDGWAGIAEPTSTFLATGPEFVYGRPRWVSLVALNAIGVRSAPLTYGPVTVPDATRPTRPVFCGAYSGGIIVYLTTPALDDETGVLGYQIRVRDAVSGATLRPFPTGATVDWPASQARANSGVRIPFTPTGGWRFLVDLRAVSGLGTTGDIAASGDVFADETPPPPAGVAGRLVRGAAVLQLAVQSDPESGLGGVDISFGTTASEPTFAVGSTGYSIPYVTFPVVSGTSTRTIVLPAQALAAPQLYVFVRVRNGAGVASTVSSARIQ